MEKPLLCEARPGLSGALLVIAMVQNFFERPPVVRNGKKAGTEDG
ncbi:hypothetical protein PQ459_18300 [Chryseobacterium sp. KACC 21268]|nr:hypothetical protein PQ459_18300 [Chryseobacterium sp. KACC 21268]